MRWTDRLKTFFSNKRGNVAIIAAFTMIPLLLATGMGIDYTFAARRQDQINGYADAAALAAVTPVAMTTSATLAQTAALNMFNAQLGAMGGVTYSSSNITVTATDTTNGTKVTRVATVIYTAGSNNAFAALLGMPTIAIGGTSTATSGVAPNTNFYLLLDTSPSMGIVATTTGINTLVGQTAPQGGCAFGCHESAPGTENNNHGLQNPANLTCSGTPDATLGINSPSGNPSTSFPTGAEDNFALARCLNLPLRIDLVNDATQNLMGVAQAAAVQNDTSYNVAIYTMDYALNQLMALSPLASPGDVTAAKSKAANIQAVEVYNNNCLTSGNCNSDEDSYLDGGLAGMFAGIPGLAGMTTGMPLPGGGTNNQNDHPQEVLMIVSDGLNDEDVGGGRIYPPISTNTTWCDKIKNEGIRIAFLYLTYNPLTTNGWYNTYIAAEQPSIATAAQACASGDLYFQVSSDGDVSGALATLFQRAIQTAHLLQ